MPKCARSIRPGERARGATLYCTLEPCCHVGRTGPCVHRIVDAGIARVVASIEDPNPAVQGRGFAYLRAQRRERRDRTRPRAVDAAQPAVSHADARPSAVRHPQGRDQHRWLCRRGARDADAPDVGCRQPARARVPRGSGRDRRRRGNGPRGRSAADGAGHLPRASADARRVRSAAAHARGRAAALDTRGRACHHRHDGGGVAGRHPPSSKREARRSKWPRTTRSGRRSIGWASAKSGRCCSKAARQCTRPRGTSGWSISCGST